MPVAGRFLLMMAHRLFLPPLAAALGLAAAWGVLAVWPVHYEARASVMLEGNGPGSRIVKIRHAARDARVAAQIVESEVADHRRRKAVVVDSPVVTRVAPDSPLSLAIGAAAGLALCIGVLAARVRRP